MPLALDSRYEIAAGSVAGRHHTSSGRNNQDACCWSSTSSAFVGIVSDGCGSGKHSEVGSTLGARLVASILSGHLVRGASLEDPMLWEQSRMDVLSHLRILANAMGGPLSRTVADHFLFTIVGVAITPKSACAFSIGDGVIFLNGDPIRLGPFSDNAPPYLAYGLFEEGVSTRSGKPIRFQIHGVQPTEQLQHVLLASDGAEELEQLAGSRMPGSSVEVGPMSQFWTQDGYFSASDRIGRKLAEINRSAVRVDKGSDELQRETPLLSDDTTLLVVRRRQKRAKK